MKLSSVVDRVEPSQTLEIAALARKLKDEGKDVISLSAGEPDFPTPAYAAEAGINAIRNGETKYTDANGIKELRKAIAGHYRRTNNTHYDENQILVTAGAKQAVFNASFCLFEKGDEVLIPSPYWVSYPQIVRLTGATPIIVGSKEENKFKLGRKDLEKNLSTRTKGLILNSPSNPTGSVYTKSELTDIAEFCRINNIWIISDEIYQNIVYEGARAASIIDVSEDAKEYSVVVNGVSKSYSMTGWRIGYAAGPQEVIRAMNKIQTHTTSNAASVSQHAALEAISNWKEGKQAIDSMVNEFAKRRNYLIENLVPFPGVSAPSPDGSFYLFLNVSSFYGRSTSDKLIRNSIDMCKFMIEEGIALVPGAAFGNDDYLRISFAASYDDIVEATQRIKKGLGKLS